MAFFELLTVGFIVLVVACILLVRHYKAPSVTYDVTVGVYFSWVLGFAGILVLPFDMSEALLLHTKSSVLNTVWHFIYWSTFALAWGTLPIQMAYHTSGGFTFKSKIREAFLQNLIFYVASGVAGILYIMIKVSVSAVSPSEVIGFLMALGNTYGVVLIIVLMGNGLVALPRRLWQMGNPETELIRLYMLAPSIESSFCDARFELEDCEEEVKRISQASQGDKDIEAMALIVQERVSSFDFAGRSSSLQYSRTKSKTTDKETPNTKRGLVSLHKRLIQAQLKVLASDRRWRILMTKARQLEELANGRISPDDSSWCEMQTAPQSTGSLCMQFKACYDQLRIIWHLHIFKYVCRVVSVICAIASAIILWSELVMGTKLKSPIGALLLSVAANSETSSSSSSSTGTSFLLQTIIFLALCYMSICTYWSLFRLNIGWAYTMQGPHLSPPSSLLFNATYFCRLQFYIGYNFILFVNVDRLESTSLLADLMQNIELVPLLGSSFAIFAPIITVVIGFFTLFNGYARILKVLGIDSEDAITTPLCPCVKRTADEQDEEKVAEGKRLIASKMHLTACGIASVSSSMNNGSNSNSSSNNGKPAVISPLFSNHNHNHNHVDMEAPPSSSSLNKNNSNSLHVDKNNNNNGSGSGSSMSSLHKSNKGTAAVVDNDAVPPKPAFGSKYVRVELDSNASEDGTINRSIPSTFGVKATPTPPLPPRPESSNVDMFATAAPRAKGRYG